MTKIATTADQDQKQKRPGPIVEKRHSPRHSAALKVRLYWSDDSGALYDAVGVVVNASEGGFGVETRNGLAVGRVVTVRTVEGSSVRCVVRHRQERHDDVLLGLHVISTPADGSYEDSMEALLSALEKH